MVPADSGRVSPAPPYSGYRPAGAPYVYGTVTPCGRVFQTCSTWERLRGAGPTTPRHMCRGLGWPAFARRYLRGHWFVFLSSGYLDVSVPRVAVPCGTVPLHGTGLPHSDTRGSSPVCGSPRLFAAYRVLRHPWGPRHPPYALPCFLSFALRHLPQGRPPQGAAAHPMVRPAAITWPTARASHSHPCQ